MIEIIIGIILLLVIIFAFFSIYNNKFQLSIIKLEKGEELVLNVIEELRQSEFSKRSALFEEIENAIHKY